MKVIHLTYLQSRILRVFCLVLSLFIEITNLVLAPFSYLKAKAHATLFTLAFLFSGYSYLTGENHGILKAFVGFIAISATIALIKLTRKKLEKLRIRLIRYTGVLPPYVYNFENSAQST